MHTDPEQLYRQRLTRYLTALRNEVPDRVPIRPFVAEFTARYAGLSNQAVTHDYAQAFEAVCRCAADFDWDAMVPNMVYVWTGLTQALGLRYYAIPGVEAPPESGFQYLEPDEEHAFMKADEYDALIADPTAFLYNVWLPRVSTDVVAPGQPATYRGALALVKGGMAMMQYFAAFGPQGDRLRREFGMPGAICGILKAPLDILGDKLRGYLGLTMDLMTQPAKVKAACEALQPHLAQVALGSADPRRQLPVGFWMHRGCVPFVTREHFETIYWPTLKPIILELWRQGHQTLFYAEGNWDAHLEAFAELPDRSIVYHVDTGNILTVHARLGSKFCLSGGIPNALLGHGTPEQVRACCRRVLEGVAGQGGYVMDASAIIQDDARPENLRALTAATREFGVYGDLASMPLRDPEAPTFATGEYAATPGGLPPFPAGRTPPGQCLPWAQRRPEVGPISGDEALLERVWSQVDGLGNLFIWQCLLSF